MSVLKPVLRSEWVQRAVAWLASRYIRALPFLGRCTIHNRSVLDDLIRGDQPVITCFWHSRVLMFPYLWRYDVKLHALISRHSDGALLSCIAEQCGFDTIRGSSSRGGAEAYRAILRALKLGECVSVTPDGPRGPRMRVGPGVVHAARMSGVPIVPIGFAASRCRIMNSWDRFVFPLPFADFVIEIGEPIRIGRDADDGEVERVRNALEERLQTLTRRVEREAGQTPIEPAPMAREQCEARVAGRWR